VLQTRFFFYGDEQIYDSRTGTTIRDFVKVLKTNSRPDSNLPLESNVSMRIIDQPVQPDGYVDDYQVLVSWQDNDADGVPDDPDFFDTIVAPTVNPTTKNVFFQQIVDFDNLQRYVLVEPGVINSQYATQSDIEVVKSQYIVGQVFYAYGVYDTTTLTYTTSPAFYILSLTNTGTTELVTTRDYITRVGRQDLFFQYRHNSSLTNRIDPGSTNIIDVYVVTQAYYTAYRNYIVDSTGTVLEPDPPSLDTLTTEYAGLQDYKMISDNMIINSVDFKPLFGFKAAPELRATIKVIRASGSTASVSEIAHLGQQIAWAEQRRDKKAATSSRVNALLNVDDTADYYARDVAGQELAERVNNALNINPASRTQYRDSNRFGEGATVTITLTIAEVEALLSIKAGA
jgi:hypothetical protein